MFPSILDLAALEVQPDIASEDIKLRSRFSYYEG